MCIKFIFIRKLIILITQQIEIILHESFMHKINTDVHGSLLEK